MLQIQILGPSCGKCMRLEAMTIEALEASGLANAHVEKVTDQRIIDRYLIEDPPGLVINNKVYWAGGDLPALEQLETWLRSAMAGAYDAHQ